MPKTITKTVYEFHDLDERAQQRVKEWLNDGPIDDMDYVLEDFKVVARLLGFMPRTTGGGQTPVRDSIYWSSYPWSAGFCAGWSFPDTSVTEALRQHLGDEADCEREALALHKDAARFEAALARFRLVHNEAIAAGNMTAVITADECGVHKVEYFNPENYASNDDDARTEAEKQTFIGEYIALFEAVREIANDLGHWLAHNLEAEHDSHWEDDYVKETCDANEYLFDENGSPA